MRRVNSNRRANVSSVAVAIAVVSASTLVRVRAPIIKIITGVSLVRAGRPDARPVSGRNLISQTA